MRSSCNVQNRLLAEAINKPPSFRRSKRYAPRVTMSRRLCFFLLDAHPSSGALVAIFVIDQNAVSAGGDHNCLLALETLAYHCIRLEHCTIRSSSATSPSADGSCFAIIQGKVNCAFVDGWCAPPNDAKCQGNSSEVRRSLDAPKWDHRLVGMGGVCLCRHTLGATSSASSRRNRF